MAKYLYFDGIDDKLTTPSLTFDKVEINFKFINAPVGIGAIVEVYVRGRLGYNLTYYVNNFLGNGFTTDDIVVGERSYSEYNDNSGISALGEFTFFGENISNKSEGELYNVKIYNKGSLIAHYDMSTGTVLDQSGNGRHATLIGGTWVGEDEPATNPPEVTHLIANNYKVSQIVGADISTLEFSFDQDIVQWRAVLLGTSHDTGTVLDSGGEVSKNNKVFSVIYGNDLHQEGNNRINIYGKNTNGDWTLYIEN